MNVSSVLARGRAAAAARMLDTCRITRDGDRGLNRDTGDIEAVAHIVYEGPCRLVLDSQDTTESEAQSQVLTEQGPRLDLPFVAPANAVGAPAAVTTNDRALILTSVTDPAQVGTRARIAGEFPNSQATARRFPVEVTSGE